MLYTITLNPAVDYVIAADVLQPGTVNRVNREEIVFGGKGINVSLMLHALGVPSTALGFVAGFTGRAIEAAVAEKGIHTDFLPLANGFSRINVKLHTDTETEINGNGPEIPPSALAALRNKLSQLQPGDTVVLSGSVPRSVSPSFYGQVAALVQEKGAQLAADAAGALLASVLPYRPFLVKPNREELAAFFGEPANTREEILSLAERLQNRGAQNVLVSMAGDGALLRTAQGTVYQAPAARGAVVNSVGAGDSMLAGFLAALSKKEDLKTALALGTAAGGATAFSLGIANGEQVRALYTQIVGEVKEIGKLTCSD